MTNDTEITPTSHKTSTRVIALVTVIAVVLGLAGGLAIAWGGGGSDANGDVWVVQSRTASVTEQTVTLENVGGAVMQISGGDDQEVTAVSISQLAQDWDAEFGDTAPRAVVNGLVDGESSSVIVNLGKPTPTADSITFEGSTIVGGGAPADFAAATLLIDNEGLVEAKLKEMVG